LWQGTSRVSVTDPSPKMDMPLPDAGKAKSTAPLPETKAACEQTLSLHTQYIHCQALIGILISLIRHYRFLRSLAKATRPRQPYA
jgi:hypothetical protein